MDDKELMTKYRELEEKYAELAENVVCEVEKLIDKTYVTYGELISFYNDGGDIFVRLQNAIVLIQMIQDQLDTVREIASSDTSKIV